MSDEERYYAMQDDSAIENHPAFERGYQAGLCDGRTEERDRISALETEMAELQARSDPDALRLWKEDMRAIACARCAALCRTATPEILALLQEHHWDMNRPGGGGRQTGISQRDFAGKIAAALATRIEALVIERFQDRKE